MIGRLPASLEVCGTKYKINADFLNVFRIFEAFDDERLSGYSKMKICIMRLYTDEIPREMYNEAYSKACWFLDGGGAYRSAKKESVRLVDFEQDETMLFAAVNAAAHTEVRACEFLHWWTFLSYYISLPPDSLYAQVINIRSKNSKKKPLEKWEKEFYKANKDIIDLRKKYSAEQRTEMDNLNKLLR